MTHAFSAPYLALAVFSACKFQRAGCPGRSSASSKYASGKYFRQVEATEVSSKADEVRARQNAEGMTTLERRN